MKTITLKKVATDRKPLDPTGNDFSELISGSTLALDQEGNPAIVYLEEPAEAGIMSRLSEALRRVDFQTSGRTGGLPSISRVFGYQPRITIRRDFCNAASLNSESPETYKRITEAGAVAAEAYRRFNPALYTKHEQLAKDVLPEYVMPRMPFTSGIINKNNQLRYHFDAGNFKGMWSAMFVFKHQTAGGYLSCPEYGIAFELKNYSLLLFEGQSILHGVTPIELLGPDSFRISIVYYSLAGMWKCLSPAGELDRIKKVRTERETRRAGR